MAPRLAPSGAFVAEYRGGLKVSTIKMEGAHPPGNRLAHASRHATMHAFMHASMHACIHAPMHASMLQT